MSVSREVSDMVERAPAGTFLRSRTVPGSKGAVDTAWSREISKRPELIRVRRGLYWKGAVTRFGVTKPSRMAMALEIAGNGAGPAGWSALSALGLTTQVPHVEELAAIDGRPEIEGVRVSIRSNKARSHLTPLEVATLEVLRRECASRADRPPVERIKELASEGAIRLSEIAEAARAERPEVRESVRELALAPA